MIGYEVGNALGLHRDYQQSNRFSRKRLHQVFDEWREKVEGLLAMDDDHLHLLDEDERILRQRDSALLERREGGAGMSIILISYLLSLPFIGLAISKDAS